VVLTVALQVLLAVATTAQVHASVMKLAKILLIGSAIIFVLVGTAFLFVPQQYAAVLEISAATPLARTDLRATYGGLELGIGIFLVLCLVRRGWIEPGLWALALATGGFATGRVIGCALEGSVSPLMLGFLVVEVLVTFLSFLCLRRLH
jgi:hypothetical protein